MRKKVNLVIIFLVILLLFFFTINDNKIYTIKENKLRNKNEEILNKQNFSKASLIQDKKVNFNRLYLYKLDEETFYMLIYTKSLIFDLYHLDDGFITKDKEINTLATNVKYHNLISVDLEKNDIQVKIINNKDTINEILFIVSITLVISIINYIRKK